MRLIWAAALAVGVLGCGKHDAPPPAATGSALPATSAGALPGRVRDLVLLEVRRDSAQVVEADLSSRDVAVRRAAARALARIADARSAELLRRMISDEDAEVVTWAAYGLGGSCKGREAAVVPALVARSAGWPAPGVAGVEEALADALARCGTLEAEITLRAWLEAPGCRAEQAALALGRLAARTGRLDDASVVALLDAAARPEHRIDQALLAFTHLTGIGEAVQERLLEVASEALARSGPARRYAVRALGRSGGAALPRLGAIVADRNFEAAARSDAVRELARMAAAAQPVLGQALTALATMPVDAAHLISPDFAPLWATLDALDRATPESREALQRLRDLPVPKDASPALARRLTMLRCRASDLLAGTASLNAPLAACDPTPGGRTGALAVLRVLDRGPLQGARAQRWASFVRGGGDAVVRQAALRLIPSHPEIRDVPAVLAAALEAPDPGVVATASQILAAYPDRASTDRPRATAGADGASLLQGPPRPGGPPHPAVVAALTRALAATRPPDAIQVQAALIDAAGALQLLTLKPAVQAACISDHPTLRQHAETALRLLGEVQRRCDRFALGRTTPPELGLRVPSRPRLRVVTDAGSFDLTLHPDLAPVGVARIVDLARRGFYAGTVVHRVIPGFVVQFGDPQGDGFGGSGRDPLRCETSPTSFSPSGAGIALAGRDTGSSQLFVTLGPYPHLDGDYPWIGTVGPGWETLVVGDVVVRVEVLE